MPPPRFESRARHIRAVTYVIGVAADCRRATGQRRVVCFFFTAALMQQNDILLPT